jgi:hypothetical protein
MTLFRLIGLAALLVQIGAMAAVTSNALREAAEVIAQKFGGRADDFLPIIDKAVAKYGDECLPFLTKTGPVGFKAIVQAGPKAPEVIKLFLQKGPESVAIISKQNKLEIFLKHGDSAADALLKHPGIADGLLDQYGVGAARALNLLSRRNAQRLARLLSADGNLSKLGKNDEILAVVGNYGDRGMDFIWQNKGAFAVAAQLSTFLAEPEKFINGTAQLPGGKSINWTLIIAGVLVVVLLPLVVKSISAFRGKAAPPVPKR